MTDMTEEIKRKYLDFMCNPENSHNCENCPENKRDDGWQGRWPCGQWHCWVNLHCKRR